MRSARLAAATANANCTFQLCFAYCAPQLPANVVVVHATPPTAELMPDETPASCAHSAKLANCSCSCVFHLFASYSLSAHNELHACLTLQVHWEKKCSSLNIWKVLEISKKSYGNYINWTRTNNFIIIFICWPKFYITVKYVFTARFWEFD